jgi:hypothetical protein
MVQPRKTAVEGMEVGQVSKSEVARRHLENLIKPNCTTLENPN